MKRICVIAPHPDDELLGAGGTILKAVDEGSEAFWLIVTSISESTGHRPERVDRRKSEIEEISRSVPFSETHELGIQTSTLDSIPGSELVSDIKKPLQEW